MTPPTVNAYYDPPLNEMVFPAGILQPPFFNRARRSRAVNYGAIGMVMGHELTHGFDDEGRKFDAKGNLRDWWTPDGEPGVREARAVRGRAVRRLRRRSTTCKLNGKLTLGENIADLGGLKLAHSRVCQATRKARSRRSSASFTDEQLFFLGHRAVVVHEARGPRPRACG